MKIAVIGAGNVGSTLAMRIVESKLGDVVLLDVVEGLAEGKALDIADAASIIAHEHKIIGTNDFNDMVGSDIVVITAGLARKPGMSRDDLIGKNAKIIKDVVEGIKGRSKDPIVIVVTNPLDVMAYYAHKIGGFDRSKVIGMAGTLDAARFKNLIAEAANVPRAQIKTYVLGSHGDTMVPLVSKTFVGDRPLGKVLDAKKISEIVGRTKNRGAEIVSYLKTGSAYYSPSAGVLEIIRSIKNDSKDILCVSTLLQGEYGINGCFLGVPAEIGRNGIVKVVEFDIEKDEAESFRLSADKTKELLSALPVD